MAVLAVTVRFDNAVATNVSVNFGDCWARITIQTPSVDDWCALLTTLLTHAKAMLAIGWFPNCGLRRSAA